jgi:hypothetical protein
LRCITTAFAETYATTSVATPDVFQTKMKHMTSTRWIASKHAKLLSFSAGIILAFCAGSPAFAEEAKPDEATKQAAVDVGNLEELKLPGIKIHTKERYVDVDATVCLTEGFLELIACTKDSKEHESVIAVNAKPSHIHASLLLIRAQPGNPAMAQKLEDGGWLDIPPRGSEIDVFLVVKDEKGETKERPISDFIVRAQEEDIYGPNAVKKPAAERGRFPTHTFLFAGSQLYKDDAGQARYISDQSGNVISLSTFGDELLCLPGKHSQENDALSWEIDSTHLPALGTKVLLRLRPKQQEKAVPDAEKETPKP